MHNKRLPLDIAAIAAPHLTAVEASTKYSAVQKKALRAIVRCRTFALGGHRSQCNSCNFRQQAYNSCRNRHCPKCQFTRKAQWMDRLKANLPPVKIFHIVFTIPPCLHKLFYINQRVAYTCLFQAAGQALQFCTSQIRFLGVKSGAVGILHTWGQTLSYHPHIHMLVPAGGFTEDGSEWIHSHPDFLVPVKLLSTVFRRLLCNKLERLHRAGKIILPSETGQFSDIKQLCYKNKWVVYSKKPFSSPDGLIQYLGNYTHRVAISNHRLLRFENDQVQFAYKDYRNHGQNRTMTLSSKEFLRRFLLHILPEGMCKIRYFGFLSLSQIKTSLEDSVLALDKDVDLPALEGLNSLEVYQLISGKDPFVCPCCKSGRLVKIGNFHNKDPTTME
jgi:hypothetical protein